ncbi:hypothetical protein M7I_2449 [Glarea lozoyensis 74030]|uniref:Uncharacterized protein n=1 Tax=Glarea lozoyensis (strain ATCC 74030 / MF5533) TaxID=1104152 RepID=H0EIT3_GLAL7|nr:hypothetical protein M7I_2449 [Glarea lozoyensis 74030]
MFIIAIPSINPSIIRTTKIAPNPQIQIIKTASGIPVGDEAVAFSLFTLPFPIFAGCKPDSDFSLLRETRFLSRDGRT